MKTTTTLITSKLPIQADFATSVKSENYELIEKAIEYIKSNATDANVTISDIADHAGFSTDYFNRIFMMHTGFTVMSYVNYTRTKEAINFLRNTDESILDIALSLGYDSHEGFIKAFKKYYGMTPSEYREQYKNKVISLGEIIDKTVATRFIHENPDFALVDRDEVFDMLLEKDAKRYAQFCMTVMGQGQEFAAPGGNYEKGVIAVGADLSGNCYVEIVTDDFELLAEWLKRFNNVEAFYSACAPHVVEEKLTAFGVNRKLNCTPESLYFGEKFPCTLPENIEIRLLGYADKDHIIKWANGRNDGYIMHLLSEKDYLDESFDEYGVFDSGELIAVVECYVGEIRGIKLNDCCQLRFADSNISDNLCRQIFSYVTNERIDKNLLIYDNIQYGEYARTHGNFTAADMGFVTVSWRYSPNK